MMTDMTQFGSVMAGAMFLWALFQQWFPEELSTHIRRYIDRLVSYFNPYITIIFHEYHGDEFERSKAYTAIERYLSANTSTRAKRLKANVVKVFELLSYFVVLVLAISFRGNAIAIRTRQRKLYTNSRSEHWHGNKRTMWSHIIFEHPSTFDTLAMDPKKKKEILNDLMTFSVSKDYYKKIGKSWKRGYLLYGPPGTGKSSMIAAMANLLDYDIYDLELTSVEDNTVLRKLLIDTSSKSIIVIEDIDCSLDLTGQRKKREEDNKEKGQNPVQEKEKTKEKKKSEVTLSGVLNFIDGLWSACGSERLVVFTTNHVEKLDPALIRRGRMDKHIEMSYCCFETFKVLAKNYLDLESHESFATIGRLLEETNMTPADVAENLMPKSAEEDAESCLNGLIKSLENAKQEMKAKTMKDAMNKCMVEEAVADEKSEDDGDQKNMGTFYSKCKPYP
ncbi:hypothetical protein E3N88_08412 [Mikania micrantha]|uniref:AAA+ ATPase domain-containing protein n=1 Tax=Mikania micrantha TaxID=192012 RepID=A0A5N6PIE6_9ASTR|nr:hypothetical protein E3N88_08412 [Mikania micrantha]